MSSSSEYSDVTAAIGHALKALARSNPSSSSRLSKPSESSTLRCCARCDREFDFGVDVETRPVRRSSETLIHANVALNWLANWRRTRRSSRASSLRSSLKTNWSTGRNCNEWQIFEAGVLPWRFHGHRTKRRRLRRSPKSGTAPYTTHFGDIVPKSTVDDRRRSARSVALDGHGSSSTNDGWRQRCSTRCQAQVRRRQRSNIRQREVDRRRLRANRCRR